MIDRLCAYANLSLFANVSAIGDATEHFDVLMSKRIDRGKGRLNVGASGMRCRYRKPEAVP
jgi:hypothetical protein